MKKEIWRYYLELIPSPNALANVTFKLLAVWSGNIGLEFLAFITDKGLNGKWYLRK